MKTRSRATKTAQEKKVNTKAGNCIRLFTTKPNTDTLLQISTSVKVYSCTQCDAIFLSASEYENHKKSHLLGNLESPGASPGKGNQDGCVSEKPERLDKVTHKTGGDEHVSAAEHLLISHPGTSHQEDAPATIPSNTSSDTHPKSQITCRRSRQARAPRVKSAPIIHQAKPVVTGPPQRKRTKEDDDPWGPSAWERRWGSEEEAPCTSSNEQDARGSSNSTHNMGVVTERSTTPKEEIVIAEHSSTFEKVENSLEQSKRSMKGEQASEEITSTGSVKNVAGPEIHSSPVIEYAATMQADSLPSMPDHIEHSDTDSEAESAAQSITQQEPDVDATAQAGIDPEEHAYTTSPLRAKLHACPLCGKLFVDPVALKRHVLIHANNKSYACNICGNKYTLESNLTAHLKTHTNERPNTCVKCGLAFGSPLDLRKHFKTHCFEKPYVCTYCDVGFATGEELTIHMKSSHTGKDPMKDAHCEQCGGTCQAKPKVFVDRSQKPYVVRIISQGSCKPVAKPVEPTKKPATIQPFKGISESVDFEKCKVKGPLVKPEPIRVFPANEAAKEPYAKPYSCKYCGEGFNESIDMRRHIRTHTGKNFHQCAICLKRFYQITQLKRHIQTHTGEKPFKCAHCNKAFVCRYDLTQHLVTHTTETVFKCTLCKKIFKQKNQLIEHKRLKHSHRKLHLCVECGASFAFSWKLKKHVRNHTGERLYVCGQCDAKFRNSVALRVHKMSHAGIKPHTCHYCEKGFLRVSSLNLHIRRHEGNKPYLCAVCGKAFVSRSRLDDHVRLHSGVKPYECTYGCGKSFHTPSYLRSHIKTHTGEKPHVCPHCGKAFSQSGNMHLHIRNVHSGRNRHNECIVCKKVFVTEYLLQRHMGTHDTHPCEVCGNTFNTRGLLYRHMRNVHNMEINPSGKLGPRIRLDSTQSQHSPPPPKKIHECTICKKEFVGDYLFKRHQGIHDIHQCEICGTILKKRSILYKHMRNIHKVEVNFASKLGPHVSHVSAARSTPDETQSQQSLEFPPPDNVVVILPSDRQSQTDTYNPPVSAQTIQPPPLHPPAHSSLIQFPTVDMRSILASSPMRTSICRPPRVTSGPYVGLSQPSAVYVSSNMKQSRQMGTHTVNAPHILSQSNSPYVQSAEPNIRQNLLNPQPGIQTAQPHRVLNQTSLLNPQARIQTIQPHQVSKKSNKFVVQTSGLQITSDTPVALKRPKGVQSSQIDSQSNKNTLNPHIRPYPIPQPKMTAQSSPAKSDANANVPVPKIRIRIKQPGEHASTAQSPGKKQKTSVCGECVYCGLKFHRTSDLVDHIKIHTGHNPYKCKRCGKAFITAAFLDRHQCDEDPEAHMQSIDHTSERKVPETSMQLTDDSSEREEPEVHKHLEDFSREREVPEADMQLRDRSGEREDVEVDEYLGDHSGEEEDSEADMQLKDYNGERGDPEVHKQLTDPTGEREDAEADMHLEDHSGEEEDPEADKQLTDPTGEREDGVDAEAHMQLRDHSGERENPEAHINSSNQDGERLYECIQCDTKFRSKAALRKHKMTHEPHMCPYCNKKFIRDKPFKRHMQRHMQRHEDSKPTHLCSVCGKTFVSESRLNAHVKHHMGIKPYQCTHGCAKTFYSTSDLKSHIKTHTGEKPNLCPHCGKAFSQIGNLRKHMTTFHDGRNRHHECPVCKRVFTTDFLLQRHMGTHDTHPCEMCGNTFNTGGLLYRHMRNVHKVETNVSRKLKPHINPSTPGGTQGQSTRFSYGHQSLKCTVCSKVFSSDYFFQRHMGTHDTHQCKICGKFFVKRPVLHRHMRTVHKIDINLSEHFGSHVQAAQIESQQSVESLPVDNVMWSSDLQSPIDMCNPPISDQEVQILD